MHPLLPQLRRAIGLDQGELSDSDQLLCEELAELEEQVGVEVSPTLVFDAEGNLFATVGSPGGSRIITYVIKALIGLMDWKLDMQGAIDLPNHANRNGATELEKNTPVAKHADTLRKLGHNVKISSLVSGLHGIRVTRDAFGDGYDGGADRRREGVALGD